MIEMIVKFVIYMGAQLSIIISKFYFLAIRIILEYAYETSKKVYKFIVEKYFKK